MLSCIIPARADEQECWHGIVRQVFTSAGFAYPQWRNYSIIGVSYFKLRVPTFLLVSFDLPATNPFRLFPSGPSLSPR